jgi:hypothetical protein
MANSKDDDDDDDDGTWTKAAIKATENVKVKPAYVF